MGFNSGFKGLKTLHELYDRRSTDQTKTEHSSPPTRCTADSSLSVRTFQPTVLHVIEEAEFDGQP